MKHKRRRKGKYCKIMKEREKKKNMKALKTKRKYWNNDALITHLPPSSPATLHLITPRHQSRNQPIWIRGQTNFLTGHSTKEGDSNGFLERNRNNNGFFLLQKRPAQLLGGQCPCEHPWSLFSSPLTFTNSNTTPNSTISREKKKLFCVFDPSSPHRFLKHKLLKWF